jgi:hypothetical protein
VHGDLQARWMCHRRRYRLKRMAKKLRQLNLVKDVHYHLANWRCKNYPLVLLPKFQTS